MDTLGIPRIGKKFPLLLYLFRPSAFAKLTVPRLLFFLKPSFSENGSNNLVHEKAFYAKFVKYVRKVSSGRRVVNLENILEFVTGASEEPVLGFAIEPSIHFVPVNKSESDATETQVIKQ